jgi:radical SAM protein (TIGR01212 family)
MQWGDKRYYSFKHFIRERFGENVKKIPIDAGFTCPNRDGALGTGGCIFCSRRGSGDTAGSSDRTVEQQISEGMAYHKKRYGIRKYIAYFQAFTGTYADPGYLRSLYGRVSQIDGIVGIAIATRPDCLAPEILDIISDLSHKKYVWVELGLQTMHERTAELINRKYPLWRFEEALEGLRTRGIDAVCHIILGLPGESREDMVQTARYVSGSGVRGIKIHLLHVLEGTALADMYRDGRYEPLSREDYVEAVADCLEVLSPDIAVHRLTGDGPRDILLAPLWSLDKIGVLHDIDRELRWRNTWQGKNRPPL